MSATESIVVRCECGQGLKVNSKHAGKQTACPKCKSVLTIPKNTRLEIGETRSRATQAAAQASTSSAPERVSESSEASSAQGSAVEPCPGCGTDLPISQMTCSECRYSKRLGKKLPSTAIPATAPGKPKAAVKAKPAKPKKRESMFVDSPIQWGTIGFGLITIAAAVIWFVVGLAAGVIFFYPIVLVFIGLGMIVKGFMGG